MTIFSNFINQGVTSHSKIKTLRYFRMRSSALARNATHDRMKPIWTNEKLKIISRILEDVKSNFPETIQFIDYTIHSIHSRARMFKIKYIS